MHNLDNVAGTASAVSFEPCDVRYIKLGAGGAWEQTARERGTLEWGGDIDRADLAEKGDWAAVKDHYIASGVPSGTATAYTRELRDLYTTGTDTLWVTFSGGYLWWAFAEPGVTDRGAVQGQHEAKFFRRTIGRWRNRDLAGRELRMVDLSTKLTQLSAYRQSICSVAESDYLLRVIRGEEGPELEAAKNAKQGFAETLLPLIQNLHQSEFELFVDLLFVAMGWRRTSILGGTMKDVDLQLELPATGDKAVVQVKSRADAALARRCEHAMRQGWPEDRVYFVYHTTIGTIDPDEPGDRIARLDGPKLATLAVDHGLSPWLFSKAA